MKLQTISTVIADRKWAADVKVNAGLQCEKCGSRKRLAAHHVISRTISAVRHYTPNGVCLCSGHHFYWAHKYPHDFRNWIIEKRGVDWWNDLQIKAKTKYKLGGTNGKNQ